MNGSELGERRLTAQLQTSDGLQGFSHTADVPESEHGMITQPLERSICAIGPGAVQPGAFRVAQAVLRGTWMWEEELEA